LVERFWYHRTNAANSDGRWPPPPRKTSAYHREWVEREIARSREALDEIASAVGVHRAPAPVGGEEVVVVPFDEEALPRLDWDQLQKQLYSAHKLYDEPPTRDEGRRQIEAIYGEYARRGVTEVVRPAALRDG
jgi:hypothetical protein